MKKLYAVYIFFTFTAILVMLPACNESVNQPPSNLTDSCGANASTNIDWFRDQDWNGWDLMANNYLENGRRYFIFYKDTDSICTDQHASARFTAHFDIPVNDIKFKASVNWNILWQRSDTGSISGRYWTSNIESIGLKQGFGENPGEVTTYIYVHFPSLGSFRQDSFWLGNLDEIGFTFSYKYHKYTSDNMSEYEYIPQDFKPEAPVFTLIRNDLGEFQGSSIIIPRKYAFPTPRSKRWVYN